MHPSDPLRGPGSGPGCDPTSDTGCGGPPVYRDPSIDVSCGGDCDPTNVTCGPPPQSCDPNDLSCSLGYALGLGVDSTCDPTPLQISQCKRQKCLPICAAALACFLLEPPFDLLCLRTVGGACLFCYARCESPCSPDSAWGS